MFYITDLCKDAVIINIYAVDLSVFHIVCMKTYLFLVCCWSHLPAEVGQPLTNVLDFLVPAGNTNAADSLPVWRLLLE